MSESEIIIINELRSILTKKYINSFIEVENENANNKSFVPKIIKKYLNRNSLYSNVLLHDYNVQLKFIPVNENYNCYEALSFSFTSLYDITFEYWETNDELMESSLKKELRKTFIFIPIIKKKTKGKYNSWKEWFIGEISVWKPSHTELKNIGDEWCRAQEIIKKGIITNKVKHGASFRTENNLLKQSKTNYIHLRPHGRNSFDYDIPYKNYTNGQVEITKQSFWLNRKFINNLLDKYKCKQKLNSEAE